MNDLKPGSLDAIKQGCLCPYFDNNSGDGYYIKDDGPHYYLATNCPLHAPKYEVRISGISIDGGKIIETL